MTNSRLCGPADNIYGALGLKNCDVCGADTTNDDEAGMFTELDGAPWVCGRPACNAAVLDEAATDTTGYELDPYPTSWGVAPAAMDDAVNACVELVEAGMPVDAAAAVIARGILS
jgi:hypothetical protein